jgi:hypothetical protein
MNTRLEAREKAIDLALEGARAGRFAQLLEAQGLGGLLHQSELESIVVQAQSAKQMLPHKTTKTLPRAVGMMAVILGAILILKPSSAKTEL